MPLLIIDELLMPAPLRAALVWGSSLTRVEPTLALPEWLKPFLEDAKIKGESWIPPELKAAVRSMLRFGKYRASGRGKPSSEYLLASAIADDFPLVNGPVDVNNAVSLHSGFPASIFDMARTGPTLKLSRGTAGESYVFNRSGQTIDLEDLVCVRYPGPAGGTWPACGNPVKDAMETKVFGGATDILAVLYAPPFSPSKVGNQDGRRLTARISGAIGTRSGESAVPDPESLQSAYDAADPSADPLVAASELFCSLLESVCGAGETGFCIISD